MKTTTKILLLLALSLVLFGALPALAQDGEAAGAEPVRDAQAVEILEKADAAIRKVTAVAFEGSMEPSGIATNFVQPIRSKGVISGWNGQIPQLFHLQVTTQGAEGDVKLEGGGNGETFYLLNHSTQKGYEDMDPGVMGSSANALQGAMMVEYVHEAPFDDELGAESLVYKGKEDVEGTSCHAIHVVYSGGRGESTWYFAEDDLLPRRRVRHFQTPQGDGAIDIRLAKIEVDPEIDEARFQMKLPEGYEQVDDFAP